jgi:cytochrome c553
VRPLAALLLGVAALPVLGRDYAERFAQQCAPCHGAAGQSALPLVPSIGGQPSFYAITQIFLFRNERRDNPGMVAVAKGLNDDDLRGFSEAVARLPPPAPPQTEPDSQRLARGRALAERHHCLACHGADGAGGQQVARLANQREDYLLHALQGFKSGTRIGYTQAMNEAIAPVKADELADLAHFLAHMR